MSARAQSEGFVPHRHVVVVESADHKTIHTLGPFTKWKQAEDVRLKYEGGKTTAYIEPVYDPATFAAIHERGITGA